MKRIICALLLTGLLAMTGCSANTNNNSSAPDVPPEPEHTEPAEIQPTPGEQPQVQEPAPVESLENPLEGLVQGEYEGLTISAAVLPRMAILPGSAVPISVTVENTGDQTVFYVLGSGSYETPDALVIQSEGLQPVLFRDRVGGVMTMDYVIRELSPGESLEFQVHVMAIEPLESFRDHTYDLYESEELYIADAEIHRLQELYEDITPVQPGSYPVQVSFVYGLKDNEEGEDQEEMEDLLPFVTSPRAYVQTELQISVTD